MLLRLGVRYFYSYLHFSFKNLWVYYEYESV